MIKRTAITGAVLVCTLSLHTTHVVAHGISGTDVAWGLAGLMGGSMYEASKNKQTARPVYYPETAAASTPRSDGRTPEQKMQQLNKLAAGGYITPAEYKAEKEAILQSIVE
ncbi:MAG: hypothetical protein HRT77_08380 [Halioglobus sp.]|nr:hypothetical protein [Halioglobus sp.]